MDAGIEFKNIDNFFNLKRPHLIVAGPCSAETEEQVINTIRAIKKLNKVSLIRAGVWKPRTRPGEFEGAGTIALEWLTKAKQETGMPFAVEVANVNHVEEALKAGVDVLWIGARTTVNPFTVQDIAEALRGVNIPVLVKNPVNPDLQLWIGAIERFQRIGIGRIGAIHRGFSSAKKNGFRNDPMWEIPIELKTIMPNLPLICDPSHICGNRDLIGYISQKALDLDMDGLMIETHIDPKKAWTDAKQQVLPESLAEILEHLIARKATNHESEFDFKIEELRKRIDGIDDDILMKIAERMHIAEQIGEFKKEHNVTALQIKRWETILLNRSDLAKSLNLNPEFTKQMLDLLHQEAINRQFEVMNKNEIQK